MQSNNPIFRRSEEFSRAGSNQTYTGYGDPSAWGGQSQGSTATGYQPYSAPQAPARADRMTIDSVVQATGISIAVVIATAIATWVVTPDITAENVDNLGPLFAALAIGSLGAFALSMVNSFKRVVSPALVLLFAVFEGVALGALSKVIDSTLTDPVVMQAVMGTFAAFAGTLAAYKFFNIKVGQKFQTFVIAAMFGMVGLGLMELMLSLFNANIGLFGFGPLGAVTAVIGLVLGVFMLILDFDFVEQGVANGIPEKESWRAAFAMTVSLVWIYTNLLRLLAILQQD
ncbi:Bax inhibitor-1/YccA family protein [Nocardioides sp. R-C-SC26]|uniref:Bax inhibitor-1/YccA family protein n=1 Tax=Nocardioides sp. R-C-SC26 TaxID=2870414 RepID=UPI001E28AF79|nr:Bax inhibitor-1/YccA family protein [Nocardioides sp. R-C-SC26]